MTPVVEGLSEPMRLLASFGAKKNNIYSEFTLEEV